MTTPTQQQIDYALMAGAAYVSSRNIINQIPTPSGWTPFYYKNLTSGFEAAAFINGSNIVISYTGTNSAIDWASPRRSDERSVIRHNF